MTLKKRLFLIVVFWVYLGAAISASASCGDPTVTGITISATVTTTFAASTADRAAQVQAAIGAYQLYRTPKPNVLVKRRRNA